jgi:hypothetical protein
MITSKVGRILAKSLFLYSFSTCDGTFKSQGKSHE